ncbi:hypothetical protein [Microbacterium sp. LWO13-1.2]|uniref:hypothetical protein n=1 Tax=Microbacterium sp. LWO13-1.2 TaxID=3135262 RepID=UPI003138C651
MKQEISRRTIVKGAAWSLPVVAVAIATPMASASLSCEAQLAEPGAYTPLTVTTDVLEMPEYRETTSSALLARALATDSTIKLRSTIVYAGSIALPVGGEITLALSLDPTRTWTNSSAVVTSGAAFLTAPVYDQSPTGPINTGWNQQAAVRYVTVAPLPQGATIIVDWQLSVTGSNPDSAPYAHTRTRFPNPCDPAGTRIDRTLVGHESQGIVTSPLAGVTGLAPWRFAPRDDWETVPPPTP